MTRIVRPHPLHGFRVVKEPAPVGIVYSDGVSVRSPSDARKLLEQYSNEDVEIFGFLPLNSQHQLIGGPIVVTRGILNSSLVHPGEIFRQALTLHESRPAALVLFHNHPSGDPTPSADDRSVTEMLVSAGRILNIPVHDHIIIGKGGRYISFAEAGLL